MTAAVRARGAWRVLVPLQLTRKRMIALQLVSTLRLRKLQPPASAFSTLRAFIRLSLSAFFFLLAG
jgi:hypothetical protein